MDLSHEIELLRAAIEKRMGSIQTLAQLKSQLLPVMAICTAIEVLDGTDKVIKT